MIGIIDYGLGNVRAFENIYRRLDIPVAPVTSAEELGQCDKLVLPGVGAFDWAMRRLTESGMLEALNRRVQVERVPVLGVCVGMQIMADYSEEGHGAGLGWISGLVKRFNDDSPNNSTLLPHMGWNDLYPTSGELLFRGVESPQYYFLHSYYFRPSDENDVIAHACYGIRFPAAVRKGNIWATQFHPEKSHRWGVALLKNFADV